MKLGRTQPHGLHLTKTGHSPQPTSISTTSPMIKGSSWSAIQWPNFIASEVVGVLSKVVPS